MSMIVYTSEDDLKILKNVWVVYGGLESDIASLIKEGWCVNTRYNKYTKVYTTHLQNHELKMVGKFEHEYSLLSKEFVKFNLEYFLPTRKCKVSGFKIRLDSKDIKRHILSSAHPFEYEDIADLLLVVAELQKNETKRIRTKSTSKVVPLYKVAHN